MDIQLTVPSATSNSIQQLLFSSTMDRGSNGIFTPVSAVQRLDTVGGIAPTAPCGASNVNGTCAVPYSASYYFYSGATIIPTQTQQTQ